LIFTAERRRRIASSVPAATRAKPNMTGPELELPVRGRLPFVVGVVVGPVVGAVEGTVVGTVLP
jgi:hypothetical protein